jgi:hypothetical protein
VRVDLGSPAELTGLAFTGGGIVALGRLGLAAALVRFTPSGAADGSFGMGGLAIFTASGTEFHPATAIGLDDQVIFTGGTTQVPPTPTHTPTPSPSATATPTNTRTATQTRTATNTASPSATRTITPTATPAPNGAGCDERTDCVSGNCVDDTCCIDPACNPGQSCGVPGSAGVCAAVTAPAPTLSADGLLLALASLLSVGGVAILRRRRPT